MHQAFARCSDISSSLRVMKKGVFAAPFVVLISSSLSAPFKGKDVIS